MVISRCKSDVKKRTWETFYILSLQDLVCTLHLQQVSPLDPPHFKSSRDALASDHGVRIAYA